MKIPVRTLYEAQCDDCGQIKRSSNDLMVHMWANDHQCDSKKPLDSDIPAAGFGMEEF